MVRIRTLLIGGAVGAAAAYFLDPEHGEARRAHLQGLAEQLALELQERARSTFGLPDLRRGAGQPDVIDGHVVLDGEVTTVDRVASQAG